VELLVKRVTLPPQGGLEENSARVVIQREGEPATAVLLVDSRKMGGLCCPWQRQEAEVEHCVRHQQWPIDWWVKFQCRFTPLKRS